MGRDISIMISAKDNFSQAITTMRNANQGFNKDLEGLGNHLKQLNSTKFGLKIEVDKAKQDLKAAEKQFQKTGEAADELALKAAMDNMENGQRNLRLVSKQAQQTEKDILSLTDAISKAENRAGGTGGGGTGGGEPGMLSGLAGAGLTKMVGDSLAGALDAGISSAFGDTTGNMISSTLSGIVSGAAMGSMLGPAGAAVGAGVGLVSGLASSATAYFEKENDAFKTYRNEAVENALQRQQDQLTSGIEVAKGREKMGVQLRHQFGDEEKAQAYLDDTINLANQTPFYYTDLIGVGAAYKSFGYANEDLFEEQKRIADAAAIRGWDAGEMEQIASTIGYMNQSGKVSLQQVKQLQMRGLNIPRYLAIAGSDLGEDITDAEILELFGASDEQLKEAGVTLTESDIYDMLSKMDGKEVAQIISNAMALEFEGGAAKLADTYYGLESTLGGRMEQMQSALGEGFAEERRKGLEQQIEWLGGDSGDEMQNAYKMIGQWEASLENSKEQMERDILSAIMDGNAQALGGDYSDDQVARLAGLAADYQTAIAEENGAEAGKILAMAQIEAQAAYNASEGAKLQQEMERQLINDVTHALAEDKTYWNAGHLRGEAMSEGLMASFGKALTSIDSWFEGGSEGLRERTPDSAFTRWLGRTSQEDSPPPGNAWGLPYVPYDNYRTRLHQGEEVLTAQEARDRRSGGGGQSVNITVNGLTVREEADVDRIAREIAYKIKLAQMVS